VATARATRTTRAEPRRQRIDEELERTFESGLLEVVKRFPVPDMSPADDYLEWLKNEIKSELGVEPYELHVSSYTRLPQKRYSRD
jgi:hypothetical protein